MSTKHFLGGRIILGTEFAGYKWAFWEPGTSTPKITYKDSGLTVGNENLATVIADANGAAQIWFSGNADVTFYTPTNVVVYTDDDINLTETSSSTGNANLILNASFEDDGDGDGIPDNWTRTLFSGGTFSLDTTDTFNGAVSAKFVSIGTGGGFLTSTSTFSVSPSIIYTVGFAIKCSIADARNVVEILWYKKDGSASATASTTVYDNSTTNPVAWTEKWAEVTAPSDAAFAAIRLTGNHSSDATAGTTRFDNVIFSEYFIPRAIFTPLISGVAAIVRATLGLAIPRSYLAGLTLSTAGASATMSIAAGQCTDSTNVSIMSLAAFSKTTSAWALGTAAGGLDTGAIANSTWYHFFVIQRPDTGVVDALISLSATAPTLPANYTLFRRIGSGKTNGSAQWTSFTQDGDYFIWAARVQDVSAANPGTAAVTRTLTVPTGVNVEAHFQGGVNNTGAIATACYFSDLAQNDEAAASPFDLPQTAQAANSVINSGARFRIRTNTSAQIRTRMVASDANTTLIIATVGWYDSRGRNA
jgi:hypothetical protein